MGKLLPGQALRSWHQDILNCLKSWLCSALGLMDILEQPEPRKVQESLSSLPTLHTHPVRKNRPLSVHSIYRQEWERLDIRSQEMKGSFLCPTTAPNTLEIPCFFSVGMGVRVCGDQRSPWAFVVCSEAI